MLGHLILAKMFWFSDYPALLWMSFLWMLENWNPDQYLACAHVFHGASLVAQTVKNLPAMWDTHVWSLGWEDPLEKRMGPHCSILAWRIPWIEELHGLQSMRLQRVEHDWELTLSFFHIFLVLFSLWNIGILSTSQHCKHFLGHNCFPLQILFFSHSQAVCDTSLQFNSVQSLSRVRLFAVPWTAARQASLSITNSRSPTKAMSMKVGDAIQPSHPLSSPSPPALNLSQHQGLFQWVSPSHQVAKVLEFQLQHQSFQ